MSENFQELFEKSLETVEMNPGAIITGVIIDIDKELKLISVKGSIPGKKNSVVFIKDAIKRK